MTESRASDPAGSPRKLVLLWGQRRDFLDPLKDALKAEGLRGIRAGASVEAVSAS